MQSRKVMLLLFVARRLSNISAFFVRHYGVPAVAPAPAVMRRSSTRVARSAASDGLTSRQLRHHDNKNLWSIEECLEKRNDIQFVDGSWYHKGERNGRKGMFVSLICCLLGILFERTNNL